MSMPVRELDSYESAASLQQKKSNKISEQENNFSIGKAEINNSAKEDTVKISREARNITEEFVKTEEREELEQQYRDSEKRAEDAQREQRRVEKENWDRVDDERIEERTVQEEYDKRIIHEMENQDRAPEVEQNMSERKTDSSEHEEKQKPENKAETEENSVIEQREQLMFKEEDWDRIEDERIEDREVQNEGHSGHEMENLDRALESARLEFEREEGPSERNEEIIAEQEDKIEEENAIRDEEADAAKAFTASYINNPSSPGNIINVTA